MSTINDEMMNEWNPVIIRHCGKPFEDAVTINL